MPTNFPSHFDFLRLQASQARVTYFFGGACRCILRYRAHIPPGELWDGVPDTRSNGEMGAILGTLQRKPETKMPRELVEEGREAEV
jgi:hypothetical protein